MDLLQPVSQICIPLLFQNTCRDGCGHAYLLLFGNQLSLHRKLGCDTFRDCRSRYRGPLKLRSWRYRYNAPCLVHDGEEPEILGRQFHHQFVYFPLPDRYLSFLVVLTASPACDRNIV